MLVGMAVLVQNHLVVDAELCEGDLLNSFNRRGVLQVKVDDRVNHLVRVPLKEANTPLHFLDALRVHHLKLELLGWGDGDDGALRQLLR